MAKLDSKNRELWVKEILEGHQEPEQPAVVVVPEILDMFIDDKDLIRDYRQYWFNVDINRIEDFIVLTMRSPNVDQYIVLRELANQVEDLLPYVREKVLQLGRNPKMKDGTEYIAFVRIRSNLQNVSDRLSTLINYQPFSFDFETDPRGGSGYQGDGLRERPKLPRKICVPFFYLVNGVLTKKFDERELDFVIHQLTGYSHQGIRHVAPHLLSDRDAVLLLDALYSMIVTIKASRPNLDKLSTGRDAI